MKNSVENMHINVKVGCKGLRQPTFKNSPLASVEHVPIT